MSPLSLHVTGGAAQTQSALLYPADPAARRHTLLILAHGAGAGQSSPWMVRYAQALCERGLDVVTFNFPYIDAGRRTPDRAPVLEHAFLRIVGAAVAHPDVRAQHLIIGGKSMGGRIATHLAAAPEQWPEGEATLDGVIVFGYPLAPPGGASRRSPDRVSHLFNIVVPTLIVQGTRDTFGGPDAIRSALQSGAETPSIAIHPVDNGDHSLAVRKSHGRPQAAVDAEVWDRVAVWVDEVSQGKAKGQT